MFRFLELTGDTAVSRIEIPIRAPVPDDSMEGTFMRPLFKEGWAKFTHKGGTQKPVTIEGHCLP